MCNAWCAETGFLYFGCTKDRNGEARFLYLSLALSHLVEGAGGALCKVSFSLAFNVRIIKLQYDSPFRGAGCGLSLNRSI